MRAVLECAGLALATFVAACVVPPATTADGGERARVDGGAFDAGHPDAAGAPDAGEPRTVFVDFARDSGPVPTLFRLGVQENGATGEVGTALGTEQRLGHVRLGLGYWVLRPATNLDDARSRLRSPFVKGQLDALLARGVTVTLNVTEMPRYLSNCPDETGTEPASGWPKYATCPPADVTQWEALVGALVAELGVDRGITWEVWNEPDGPFWAGTPEQFFEFYRATARAIRRADPSAKVGGPTVSWPWAGTRAHESATRGFIERFLAYCASHPITELGLGRTPVDFVVWHAFGLLPDSHARAIRDVRHWVADAGYSVDDTELQVDEWNIQLESTPPPSSTDATQSDSEVAAAYGLRTLLAMQRAGLTRHTWSAAADWSAGASEFHGGQGLTTTSGLRKPVWNAMRLAGLLDGRAAEVSTREADGPYRVDGMASVSADQVVVLLTHFAPEWAMGLSQYFEIERAESRPAAQELAALSKETLTALWVDFTMTPDALPVSAAARALAADSVALSHQLADAQRPTVAKVVLAHVPPGFTRVQRFVVDRTHANSFRVFESTRSVDRARAAMGLEPVETAARPDEPSAEFTLTLEAQSVVALVLTRP